MFGIINNFKRVQIKTIGNECRKAILIDEEHPMELTICGETDRWVDHHLWVASIEKRSGNWVERCRDEIGHYVDGDEKRRKDAFAFAECAMRDFVEHGF